MISRDEYLNKLISWKDKKVIKVITGIRRCGKSTLMNFYCEYLLHSGVKEDNIIYLNFEDLENESLLNYSALYEYIKSKIKTKKKYYILLDEIQKVEDFQKAVDSIALKDNTDIVITGSNAYLLSGELATLLSGRYVEIKMLPLSFKEFCEIKGGTDHDSLFAEYLKNGSLPYVASLDDESLTEIYLEGIYNTIIIKDIEERQKRKEADSEKRKVNDIVLLKNIAKFLAANIGNPVSVKSIADFIVSSGRKVSQNTVSDYIEALTEPYIFYAAERYDVSGKQLLKTNLKYYIADLGLRRYMVQKKNYDLGFMLENVIYFELLRRGYRVNVGKINSLEVDFVATKEEKIQYIQVTADMTNESTFKREMKALNAIADNYEKTVITLDKFTQGNYDGIKVVNAIDWLLNS